MSKKRNDIEEIEINDQELIVNETNTEETIVEETKTEETKTEETTNDTEETPVEETENTNAEVIEEIKSVSDIVKQSYTVKKPMISRGNSPKHIKLM